MSRTTLARTLLAATAFVSLTAPALAGGWGGRYGAHDERYEQGARYEQGGYAEHNAQSDYYQGEDQYADGGYHAYGGGYSRREERADSGWRYRDLITGRELDGPPPGFGPPDGPDNSAWGCGYGATHWQRDAWVNGRHVLHREGGRGYGDEARCPPPGMVLPGSFFADSGGVGGFGGYDGGGGGGGGVVFAGAGAGAHASAFASASARVSVSVRGRGGHGGHGGKGCGCGGHH